MLLAPVVWWIRVLPAPTPTLGPIPANPQQTAVTAPLPPAGTRQSTEDLGRLLALAQAHGIDVPLARYEWLDDAARTGSAPDASASSPSTERRVLMQLSLVGPMRQVESMLREATLALPHATTQHLALEALNPGVAANSASPVADTVRAQWRLMLRYRGTPL